MNHHNHKFRFFFFFFFAFLSYVIFFVSAFFFNAIFYAVGSFILLFVFLYFLSIDLYARKRIWVWLNFLGLTLIEFLIMLGHTRHVFLGIILFNLSILILVLFLLYHLKIRSSFSAFAYFTEGGYIIAALLTVFFSVLLLGKYSEIPFTCDDIEQFPENLVEGQLNKMSEIKDTVKGKWNHRFSSEEPKVELYEKEDFIQELPLLKKTTETSGEPVKTGIGNFFQNIQNGVVDVQGEISKKTCEYSMEVLRKTQINDGLQVAVIVLLYFILISVFKLILWIVSFIGFLLFIILKPFRIYTFTKGVTEKEEIG